MRSLNPVDAAPGAVPTPVAVGTARRLAGRVNGKTLGLHIALAALMLAPAVFWRGGVLEEEAVTFITNYLDERSLLQKVFDPRGDDFTNYQARELSYVLDFLDAHAFRALARSGIVIFIPPSAVAASLLTWVVFGAGSRRVFSALPAITRSLALLVLFTNYVFLTTMGLFYRSAKPMLVPTLLGLLFYLWQRLRGDSATTVGPGRDFAVVFGLSSLASAFDRQGFFYVAVTAVGLGLVFVYLRRGAALAAGAAAAAAANTAYNWWLGPLLIHRINGYWPSFRVQHLAIHKLIDPTYYLKAAELLPGYAATLFGGFPTGVFLLGAATAGFLLWQGRSPARQAGSGLRGGRGSSLVPHLVLLFAASQVFMFGAMIMKYPHLYDWSDHRVWYFPWPFQTLLIFGLLVALDCFAFGLGPRGVLAVNATLLFVSISNVAHWPGDREISLHSVWFPKVHDQTERLVSSLRDGHADPQIYGAYREFLHFVWDLSPELSSRIVAEVVEGPDFYPSELQAGQVFAWARKGTTLGLRVAHAGEYELHGRLWLRPGEAVSVSRGGAVIASVSRLAESEAEGTEELRLRLTLAALREELSLESNLPERAVGGIRHRRTVAFGLFLDPSLTPSP